MILHRLFRTIQLFHSKNVTEELTFSVPFSRWKLTTHIHS